MLSTVLLSGLLPARVPAQDRHALQAYPVSERITIDGYLDEPAWQRAEAVTGFRQFEPIEGAPASQPTEVRILYGERYVFVGATLYDDRPEAIRALLGRRDEINQADWFIVSFDSYFDQRTAYTFAINAAGVQYDGLRTAGSGGNGPPAGGLDGVDASWDAVWASAVRITPQGWTAELRIPYSMLRFSREEVQTWGIHFARRIPRVGEVSEWPLIPRTQRENLVARYGRLEGLHQIQPRRNLQVIPYTLGRLNQTEGTPPGTRSRSGEVDLGADLKLGIGSGITLDATVNPDFGQVESDPAVLNLTAFETFFEERRPFFVEGAQIYAFSVGPGQLLYTRRIGAEAPIVGATKLSGRSAGGTSFGVLAATTGEAMTPERAYGVARVLQQIGAFSSAGGALTVFDAPAGEAGRRRSIAGGLDWDLRLAGNRYGVEGFSAFTQRRHPTAPTESGFASKLWFRKRQGAWKGFAGLDVFSDGFNPNDLGQLRQRDFFAALLSVDHDLFGGRPFGPFQQARVGSFLIQQLSYRDGLDLGLDIRTGSRWTLRSFRYVELDVEVEQLFGGYDPYETRGLGPYAAPRRVGIGGLMGTDTRRSWLVEPAVQFAFDARGGRGTTAGLRGEWNVGTRLSLSGNLEVGQERDVVAWSSNETFRRTPSGWAIGAEAAPPDALGEEAYVTFDDQGLLDTILEGVPPFDAPGRYYVPVFGARDTRSLDLTLRSTITFTPALSLQCYGQLFAAGGRFERFQILRDRDTLLPFGAFPKHHDFSFSQVTANTVLRWEYRPGSVLYLVWTHRRDVQNRIDPLAPATTSPFDTPLADQLSEVWGIIPQNVFLVKLNYTLLR